ncbi:MAG TPA: hypothetical protein VGC46_15735 [Allosphingosinicella sp.]
MSGAEIDFGEDGYAAILRRALGLGYKPVPLCDGLDAGEKSLILRHDVDYSIEKAVRIAELEAGLGLRSTYFILLGGPFYNVLAPKGRQALARIAALGHEIGLHFDTSAYPEDPAAARANFAAERDLLAAAAGVPVRSASQHNPSDKDPLDLSGLVELDAYAPPLMARYRYVSDSCMRWRAETPLDLLESGVDVYFLTHPIWWTTPGQSLYGRLAHALGDMQAGLNGEMTQIVDYLGFLLAERDRLDAEFKARRGWGESEG